MPTLTTLAVKAAKPAEKPYKLADGGGLICLVTPAGGKLWNLRYKLDGREKKLSLGAFPGVGLAEAREAADKARALLREGVDPSAKKRSAKVEAAQARRDTFEYFARGVLDRALARFDPATCRKWRLHMGYALAQFGKRPIAEISRVEVIEFLRTFEKAGKVSTMRDVKSKLAQTFAEAIELEACTANPAVISSGRLLTPQPKPRAAILDPVRFGQLLRAIDAYGGDVGTVLRMKFSALTFQRPGEIRLMRWAEIDWQNALWEIPAERMKKVRGVRLPHLVPLSRQALEVLRDLQRITGQAPLAFPAVGKPDKPCSDMTIGLALRRMGFAQEEMSAHGFRASANTLIKERVPFPAWILDRNDTIQRQLAHREPNEVTAAYDRSILLRERTWMMQAWADYCDTLREGGQVVPIGGGKPAARQAAG
jgi:integrase